jgi:hypothetical protein
MAKRTGHKQHKYSVAGLFTIINLIYLTLMKKRIIFALKLTLFTLFIVFACTEEHDAMFEENESRLVEDAKRLYDSFADNSLVTMRSSKKDNAMAVKPFWKQFRTEKDNNFEVVEVALLSEKGFTYTTPEALEKYKEKGDKGYLRSNTSFVYKVDRKTKEKEMFIMTIVPDLSCLKSTRFNPFKKMSYLKRDRDFSGYVFYHNLYGEFVNGWRYIDGKITATIREKEKTPGFDMVETRATTCYDVSMVYLVEACSAWVSYTVGYDYEAFGMECYSFLDFEYLYTECDYSGGGGDEGGFWPAGGGGGGNSSNPPTPTSDPCASGSTANQTTNSIFSNSTVQTGMNNELSSKVNAANEWSVSIGKMNDGSYVVSNPLGNQATHGIIPPTPQGSVLIADGHTHGEGSSGVPSAGDLYGFLEQVANDGSTLQTRFVYGVGFYNYTIYAITLHNKTAVQSFLANHPRDANYSSFTHDFSGDVGKEYNDMIILLNDRGYNDASTISASISGIALAYIMNYFNMGVTLSISKEGESFKIISALKNPNTEKPNVGNCGN